jgi:hypothetical protein
MDDAGFPTDPKEPKSPNHWTNILKVVGASVFAVAFVWMAYTLTAGGDPDAPDNPGLERRLDDPAPETPTDLPDPSDKHAMTLYSFNQVWDAYTTTDRDEACDAVNMFGVDFAADNMQAGAEGSDELDWELMARLLKMECDFR